MGSKSGKRYTPKLKFTVILEALKSDTSDAEVARAYEMHPATFSRWKELCLEKDGRKDEWPEVTENTRQTRPVQDLW